jgi:hypothetical protein
MHACAPAFVHVAQSPGGSRHSVHFSASASYKQAWWTGTCINVLSGNLRPALPLWLRALMFISRANSTKYTLATLMLKAGGETNTAAALGLICSQPSASARGRPGRVAAEHGGDLHTPTDPCPPPCLDFGSTLGISQRASWALTILLLLLPHQRFSEPGAEARQSIGCVSGVAFSSSFQILMVLSACVHTRTISRAQLLLPAPHPPRSPLPPPAARTYTF